MRRIEKDPNSATGARQDTFAWAFGPWIFSATTLDPAGSPSAEEIAEAMYLAAAQDPRFEVPNEPPTFKVTFDPPAPKVGDLVRVMVEGFGSGGLVQYTLGMEPEAFEYVDSRKTRNTNTFGNPVFWDLRAVHNGNVNLWVSANYETQRRQVSGRSFYFTNARSDLVTVNIAAAPAHTPTSTPTPTFAPTPSFTTTPKFSLLQPSWSTLGTPYRSSHARITECGRFRRRDGARGVGNRVAAGPGSGDFEPLGSRIRGYLRSISIVRNMARTISC